MRVPAKWSVLFLGILLVVIAGTFTILTLSSAQALGPNAIRSGFDGNTLPRGLDNSSGSEQIGFTINFFGTNHSSLFVNANGNLTFNAALSTFSPFDLGTTTKPIIAPFFADTDTRIGGNQVTFGTGDVGGRTTFGATWPGIRCLNDEEVAALNHF